MGVQFQQGFSSVDGNYGFGDGCFAPNVLDADRPGEPGLPRSRRRRGRLRRRCRAPATTSCGSCRRPTPVHGRPTYQFTREEDINIGNGDEFVPPGAAPGVRRCAAPGRRRRPGCRRLPGARRPTDINGVPTGVTVPASTPTDSPTLVDIGGSPYEGLAKPLCDTKLVPLANGRSIVPTFNVFTDVPLPGRFFGLLVDDLNFSSDPTQINYGEKSGIRFAPVGIYDYTDRLVYTVESDNSGLFDVLMPSTNRINCPTPSGVCGNLYRFVGNDPGTPGQLNPNYRPEFRTIAAEFEAIPGNLIPADLAPDPSRGDGAAPRRSGHTGAVRPAGERAAVDGRRPPLSCSAPAPSRSRDRVSARPQDRWRSTASPSRRRRGTTARSSPTSRSRCPRARTS